MSKRIKPLFLLAISVVSCAAMPGCALWGSGKLEQCQSESERLLSDYRQQRERADRLEDQNRLIADRLAQLEQRLAQLQESPAQRLATRPAGQPDTVAQPAPTPEDGAAPADVPVPDPWRAAPREREKP